MKKSIIIAVVLFGLLVSTIGMTGCTSNAVPVDQNQAFLDVITEDSPDLADYSFAVSDHLKGRDYEGAIDAAKDLQAFSVKTKAKIEQVHPTDPLLIAARENWLQALTKMEDSAGHTKQGSEMMLRGNSAGFVAQADRGISSAGEATALIKAANELVNKYRAGVN